MLSDSSIDLIRRTGGQYSCFCQNEYISKNQWDHIDSCKRQGAWGGDMYNPKTHVTTYGLGAGVCTGLAGAYLIAGKNFPSFKSYIDKQEGKAFIRGMMNLKAEMFKNGCINPDKIDSKFMKVADVHFIKEKKISQYLFSKNMGNEIIRSISPEFKYLVSFHGDSWGHALALRTELGSIKLFDPNYGEIIYPENMHGRTAMANSLNHLFHQYYPPFYNVYIQRYALS